MRNTPAVILLGVLVAASALAQTPESGIPAPLSLRAVVHPQPAYVGQQVTIGWFLDAPRNLDSWTLITGPRPGRVVMPVPLASKVREGDHDVHGIRSYVFHPEQPGTIVMPPVTVRARFHSPVVGRDYDELDLTSPPLRIEVRPLPDGVSAAAVGFLSINCRAMETVKRTIEMELDVVGTVSFFDAVTPRFEETPDFRFELVPDGPATTRVPSRSPDRSQAWKLRLFGEPKSRLVTVPDIVADYFDPRTGTRKLARCELRDVALLRSR